MNAPIELTLYNSDDEPISTFKRSIVPWGVLKKAMSLMQALEELSDDQAEKPEAEKTRWEKFKEWFKRGKTINATEVQLQMLEEFLVEFFGNKFTAADLKNADTMELMSVLQSIITRASAASNVNPMMPRQRIPHK
jgi:hypothetical protein